VSLPFGFLESLSNYNTIKSLFPGAFCPTFTLVLITRLAFNKNVARWPMKHFPPTNRKSPPSAHPSLVPRGTFVYRLVFFVFCIVSPLVPNSKGRTSAQLVFAAPVGPKTCRHRDLPRARAKSDQLTFASPCKSTWHFRALTIDVPGITNGSRLVLGGANTSYGRRFVVFCDLPRPKEEKHMAFPFQH